MPKRRKRTKRSNDPDKRRRKRPGRRKGAPGTKTYLEIYRRREKLKELLPSTRKASKLAKELGVSVRTVEKDMVAIRDEVLDNLEKADVKSIFADFLEGLDEDQAHLKNVISKALTDIKSLPPEQKSSLYTNIVMAVRTSNSNRATAYKLGQSLGIYPQIRPGIDISISYEEKRYIVVEIISDVVAPIILDAIKDKEDQRRVAKEIDARTTAYLSKSNFGGTDEVHKGHKK